MYFYLHVQNTGTVKITNIKCQRPCSSSENFLDTQIKKAIRPNLV